MPLLLLADLEAAAEWGAEENNIGILCRHKSEELNQVAAKEWLNDSINQSTQSQGGAFHLQCLSPKMMIHHPNLQPWG